MMKKVLLASVAAVGFAVSAWSPTAAHNVVNVKEAPAGYLYPMAVNVNHGCKGSPVVGLRLKIPEGVVDAKAEFTPLWDIEYKMRTLDEPIELHGRPVTEVVDEIIWKNPMKVQPADAWSAFSFRMTIPNEPGRILYFKNITVCEEGTDPYVDMPEQELSIEDPEFAAKTWGFMTATPHPTPMVVIREPGKKQYPWEWTPEQARGDGSFQQSAISPDQD